MDPITDCFQASCTEKREEITFEEERQGVCKDDSSPTVAHVCPHHQLQVLLCFFGHLGDSRDRQRAQLKASDGFKDKQATAKAGFCSPQEMIRSLRVSQP